MDRKTTTAKELKKPELNLDLIKDDLKEVEKILFDQSRSDVSLVTQVNEHLLQSGGKRFRPSLLLLSGRLCGYEGRDQLLCAAAVEYAHTATLLHDDVIDEARSRRGRSSANRVFGNKASVLVGDYLLFQGFRLVMEVRNLRIMDLITDIAVRMAEGETRELENLGNLKLSESDYFDVIIAKTAVLIQSSCRIGAILGEADSSIEELLADFGLNTGIAFQLVDDALDYSGDEKLWGKEVGKDFNEAKSTLPLLYTCKSCSRSTRARIEELFKKRSRSKSDFREVLGYITECGGTEYTLNKAGEYIEKAKSCLDSFPDSEARRSLVAMADYVLERRV